MKREKITITLREDVLRRIDATVDSERIRNRSHAIEYLLNQILRSGVKKALILTGGRKEEIKVPKEKTLPVLLPFEGKLLLEHQIELLKNAGVRDIFILVDDRGEEIKQHFGDGSRFDVSINYGQQRKHQVGTGYALYFAQNFFSKEPFLMLYGDVFAEIDLEDFISYHLTSNVIATVALTSIRDPSLYGVANLRGGKIVEFVEKPKEEEELSRVISAGLFCFHPKIFDYLSDEYDLSLEKEVLPKLAKEGKLGGYLFEGKWCNVRNQICYEGVKRKSGK